MYDLIVVGGGLGGASLGRAMAERGHQVLILERETKFRDRVRGEQMSPWGVAEAKALGVYDLMRAEGGHECPELSIHLGPLEIMRRNLPETTPQAVGHFNMYHPAMQQVLLDAAVAAGAEVRRGVRVTAVKAGAPPSVTIDSGETIPGRLVVGADGRGSLVRAQVGFEVRKDDPFLVIAGMLLENVGAESNVDHIRIHPEHSRVAFMFPQGGQRARAYVAYPASSPFRLSGEDDFDRFVDEAVKAGANPEWFAEASMAGPLATHDATDTWVDHPYRDGVALIGDAAASNNPAWGQGLSLTLRDVRVLRDKLLADADWDRAAHAYAEEHDRHYGVIHDVTRCLSRMFIESGAAADALRMKALPLFAEDETRMPDHPNGGPDLPWNDEVKARFFAEV